jgi:hypothetical protein
MSWYNSCQTLSFCLIFRRLEITVSASDAASTKSIEPADTPEEYWRRSVYYPLLDHIANELETRLVVPKDRFLAQYLIPSKLASLH